MAAVPPNVTNAAAQAALNVANDVPGPPTVRAARSSKRLRIARELHSAGSITEAELGRIEGFHTHVSCAVTNAGPPPALAAIPGVPAWFAPAMAASLAPMQNQLNNIEGRLNNIEGRLDNIEGRLINIEASQNNTEARQNNAVASDRDDPLLALSNGNGIVYANFPNTLRALNDMTGPQMIALLNHYQLAANGNNTIKLQRIKKFIGLRIA